MAKKSRYIAVKPTGPHRHVICYDVPNDARRARISRHLTGYGKRVQYSLFECWLTQRELNALLFTMERMFNPDEDNLLVVECSEAEQPQLST
jgi:CRISPR-associated protein Cas2